MLPRTLVVTLLTNLDNNMRKLVCVENFNMKLAGSRVLRLDPSVLLAM